MRAVPLFGYQIEYTSNGDAGHDGSAHIAPSDRFQQTGHFVLLGLMGNYSTLIS